MSSAEAPGFPAPVTESNDSEVVAEPVTDARLDQGLTEIEQQILTDRQAEWDRQRGFEPGKWESYIRLSNRELEALADGGDVEAMQQLGARLIASDPEKSNQHYERAALWGSTIALLSVSGNWANHSEQRLAEVTTLRVSRSREVNALAIALVAELRGDNRATPPYIEDLRNRFEYTDEMLEESCNSAMQGLRCAAGQAHPPRSQLLQR